jgi:hypothetical protein
MGPNGGGTSSLDRQGVGQSIRDLPPDQITAILNAVADYVCQLPASNGKVVVAGYCWGQPNISFRNEPTKLEAAFVFMARDRLALTTRQTEKTRKDCRTGVWVLRSNDARISDVAGNNSGDDRVEESTNPSHMRAPVMDLCAGDAPEPTAPATQTKKLTTRQPPTTRSMTAYKQESPR